MTTSATSVTEGNAVTFTVTPSAVSATAQTLNYQVSGSATTSGSVAAATSADFTVLSGSVTVPANATTATFSVTPLSDNALEGFEGFKVNLLDSTFNNVASSSVVVISDPVSNTSPGTAFTLTTGNDVFAGGGADDTVSGSVVYDSSEVVTSTATLALSDQITGNAGTDTLNVTISGAQDATVAFPVATITSVETFNIRNTVAQTLTVDASNYTGITALNSDRSGGVITVTNLPAAASAGVIGNTTIVNAAFNAGWVGSATSGTLNISSGTTGTGVITTSGTLLAAQTVNSTGASNTVGALTLGAAVTSLTINATTNLTTGAVSNTGNAALTTLTVTGTGAVNLSATALEATVTTINASANTGGLTVTLPSAVTANVTGSGGNDVITTGAILTTGSVNAGLGDDTLAIATLAHANTATLAAKYTGFENIRLGEAGSFDAALFPSALIQSKVASTVTNMTAAQAADVKLTANVGADGTGDTDSFALASSVGTSDVLKITLGTGSSSTVALDINGLTAQGFETINLVANPGSSSTVGANRVSTIASFTDTSLTAVNLTGTSFALSNIATTKATTFNGSLLTGDGATPSVGLTVAGTAVNGSSIIGSGVNDTFTIGAEGSSYDGGAGNDGVSVANTILAADGNTDVTVIGGLGTDTLTITGAGTLTDNNFTNVSGFENLASALTTAISYTGFGAAAKTAFPTSMTVTTGTLANDAAYTFGSGLYDKPVTLTLTSSGDGASTADNITIVTGSAADTINVTANSWVGGAGAVGLLNISTGAGNDSITYTHGTQAAAVTGNSSYTITPGTGADIINATGVNHSSGLTDRFTIAPGDSPVTGYDSITGYDLAGGGLFASTLDFTNVGVTNYAATAATGFAASELTVAVASTGLVTFAGTLASAASLAQKIAAVQSVVVTTQGDTAIFTNGSNTYVFNNDTAGDSVVELVGVAGTSVTATNATTAGMIFIA